jgi:hypothetical protein
MTNTDAIKNSQGTEEDQVTTTKKRMLQNSEEGDE